MLKQTQPFIFNTSNIWAIGTPSAGELKAHFFKTLSMYENNETVEALFEQMSLGNQPGYSPPASLSLEIESKWPVMNKPSWVEDCKKTELTWTISPTGSFVDVRLDMNGLGALKVTATGRRLWLLWERGYPKKDASNVAKTQEYQFYETWLEAYGKEDTYDATDMSEHTILHKLGAKINLPFIATTSPGEGLFVPAYWAHCSWTLEAGYTASLPQTSYRAISFSSKLIRNVLHVLKLQKPNIGCAMSITLQVMDILTMMATIMTDEFYEDDIAQPMFGF